MYLQTGMPLISLWAGGRRCKLDASACVETVFKSWRGIVCRISSKWNKHGSI